MTTIQLQYFLLAAKTLNFTEAASKVYTTHSAFSRQIAALEEELGVKLFHRTNNVLELTVSGCFFYDKAKDLYENFQESVKQTRAYDEGIRGVIRIGLIEDHILDSKLSAAVSSLIQANPDIDLNIYRYNYKKLLEKLNDGTLDIAQTIIYDKATFPDATYKTVVLDVGPLCLAINKNVIKTDTESIKCSTEVADIVGSWPLVMPTLESFPETMHRFMPGMFDTGNKEISVRYTSSLLSVPLYLTTGIAASIADYHNVLVANPAVKLIPLEDTPPITEGLIYCSGNTNPLLGKLLANL